MVWEWERQDDDSDGEHMSESSAEDLGHSHHNPYTQTESLESKQELEFQLPSQTHTVTFKCIGTTHNFNAQEVASKVSTLLEQGEQVHSS